MEGKRGSECLLKPVSNIDFNPIPDKPGIGQALSDDAMTSAVKTTID